VVVRISHPEKVFFPDVQLTKGDVVEHYRTVAGVMLPHLAGRPLTLRRFPDGIDGQGFFQKDASDHFPDWIETVPVERRSAPGVVHHVVCSDVDTLLYLANQATIEFHIWSATVPDLDHPDRLVIDIDPLAGVPVAVLRSVARRLRDAFAARGLTPFVQATGGRGFHVVAPLEPVATHDMVRAAALDLAEGLVADDPDLLTTAQRKDKRGDRVFLDVNRNGFSQTFVAPYSLRARPGAPVATPLDWRELTRATPDGFTPQRIRRRLARKPDPWSTMNDHRARLPST
jgi:bifunctional non-homologous end joining protein LigD